MNDSFEMDEDNEGPNLLVKIVTIFVVIMLFLAMLTSWQSIDLPGF